MPLRLLQGAPDPGALYDLFRDAGQNVATATATLSELIEGWPEDPEGLRHQLVDLEHEGDRLTHDIYHRLLSEAHTPVDHSDALSLASELDDVVDLSEEVGDFLALYRIEAPMDQAVQLAGVLKLSGAEIGTALAKLAHPEQLGAAPHRAGAARGRRGPRRARGAGLPVRRGRGPHGRHTMEGSLRATRAGHRRVRARRARARGHRPERELSSSPVLGCIDIGSNTTRLLVAQCEAGSLRELASQRAFTRIGKSLKKDGRIPKKKVEEIAAVVAAQARAARESGVQQLVTVATAAIRDAPNRLALADAVRRSGGGDLRVVSGDEEARLAFVGAARTLTTPADGTLGVVDVGGGSTEIAVGDGDGTVELVRVLSHRLGLPGRLLPAVGPAGGVRARGGAQPRGRLLRGPRAPAASARGRRGRDRRLAAPAAGRRAGARDARARDPRAVVEPHRRRRRALRARPGARAAAPRRHPRPGGGVGPARDAAAHRPRRVCARA